MRRRSFQRQCYDKNNQNNKQNRECQNIVQIKRKWPSLDKMKVASQKEKPSQQNYDRHHQAIKQRNKEQEKNCKQKEIKQIRVQEYGRQGFANKNIGSQQLSPIKSKDIQGVKKEKKEKKVLEGELSGEGKQNKKQYPAGLKKDQLNESQKIRIRNMKITVQNSDKVKEDGTIPIKLVLVGDGNAGKTSMLISYTTDNFPTDYVPTVFDNYVADVKVGDNKVKLWLWDTAGQEEYEQLRLISYQKADVFFICFSMIDQNSFYNALNKWFREVHEECPKAIKIFVGTKYDLHQQYLIQETNISKAIPIEYIEKKCAQKKCNFMPCSALNQKGLNQVFTKAMTTIIERVTKKKKQQSALCQLI